MLVRHPRNRSRDPRPERAEQGDGFEVSHRPSTPMDKRVELPKDQRKFVEEERGGTVITTWMDPPPHPRARPRGVAAAFASGNPEASNWSTCARNWREVMSAMGGSGH